MWDLDGELDIHIEKLQFSVDTESTETASSSESDCPMEL